MHTLLPLRSARALRAVPFAVAAAVLVAAVARGSAPELATVPPRSEGEAAFTARTALDAPFLVLDLGAARMDLYHGPALLRSFEVFEPEVGRSRWAAWSAAPGVPGPGPWTPEEMSPTRQRETRVVRPQEAGLPDPSGSVEWIPPRPEELNPDPTSLRVRYAGGLTLHLRAEDAPSRRWELAADGDLVIRLRMSRPQLGLLFRSLPDSAVLVVVSPPSG